MSSTYGKNIIVSIFGQSHSPAIGVSVDGLPAGIHIDTDRLQQFMDRRAPGRNEYSTARKEADIPEIISGLAGGVTCGAPLAAIIRNGDHRSKDYDNIRDIPRPSHADYTARIKYKGFEDASGGGHFSGRLTAPLCVAGGICIQVLEEKGIKIGSRIMQIGSIADRASDSAAETGWISQISSKAFPVIDDAKGAEMKQAIADAKAQGDSLGGIIECVIEGMPAGIGDPMFGGLENRISCAVFGVPAVRGIEFGAGFAAASMKGSEHNDPFRVQEGRIVTAKNDHGGILGGISSGMPVVFRVAIKPTPSIALTQESVSMSRMEDADLVIHGRHDPCIVPRALPCIEAAAAIAILDAYLEFKS
ncbi:MAG: chorismate synthase [Bacillota bacterium]|nr:chorismate synthase [Bacillota bacterium]